MTNSAHSPLASTPAERSPRRCHWATDDPVYQNYHDHEWGRPVKDEQLLFEFLVLESFQAGLSWITILKRREGFRTAFDSFDAHKIAQYGQSDIDRLMATKSIIRNKRKIEATIQNANATLALRAEGCGLSGYLWSFVNHEPILNTWATAADVPAKTELSERISKDLKSKGFAFVGPTIVYALMQAAGFVNDHTQDCDLYQGPKDTHKT